MEEIINTDHDSFYIIEGKLIPTKLKLSETPINGIIKIDNQKYKVVDMKDNWICDGCSFYNGQHCTTFRLPCEALERKDKKNVIFKLDFERKVKTDNGLYTTDDLRVKRGFRWKR